MRVIIRLNSRHCFPIVDFRQTKFPLDKFLRLSQSSKSLLNQEHFCSGISGLGLTKFVYAPFLIGPSLGPTQTSFLMLICF